MGVSSWHSALNCVRSCNLTDASSSLPYATGNKLHGRHSLSSSSDRTQQGGQATYPHDDTLDVNQSPLDSRRSMSA